MGQLAENKYIPFPLNCRLAKKMILWKSVVAIHYTYHVHITAAAIVQHNSNSVHFLSPQWVNLDLHQLFGPKWVGGGEMGRIRKFGFRKAVYK